MSVWNRGKSLETTQSSPEKNNSITINRRQVSIQFHSISLKTPTTFNDSALKNPVKKFFLIGAAEISSLK